MMRKVFLLFLCVAILLLSTACGVSETSETSEVPQIDETSELPQIDEIIKLYLYGDMGGMYEKNDVRMISALFKQEGNRVAYHATIKVQGTSSLGYEKKNYTIKLYEDPDHEVMGAVDVGWGTQNEYCLKANWIDKTHARNIVTAKLAAEIQSKYNVLTQAPNNGLIDGFPVEVYINDQYHGLYTWNIPKSAWQFGMDEDNPNHIVMCGEHATTEAVFYDLSTIEKWSVDIGPDNEETYAKFTRLADFILNSSDEEFKEHFSEYIDLDAMLNYFVLAEFAFLGDNLGRNMLMATYDGEVWYPSLYDLDTSWGTNWNGMELLNYKGWLVDFASANNLACRVKLLFAQELHDRYFELRNDILTKEHIMELFYAFDARIPEETRAKEEERWGENIPGYDLKQIEEYLDSVIERRDEQYRNLVH